MNSKPLIAAALATLLSVPAAAQPAPDEAAAARRQERSERFYLSLWWVQPSREPLGRKTVRDGDYVIRTRLLPPSLIRLNADAVAEQGGRVLLPAGSQLFGLSTSGPPIWCAVARRSTGGRVPGAVLGALVGRRAPSQLCLVDLDRDGRLDAFFSANSPVRGVPNFSGNRPRNPARLAPVAFAELDPEQMETQYFVGIRYEGVATLRSSPHFSVSYGDEDTRGHLTRAVSPQNGVVAELGAEFEIVRRDGETLEVEIRRNMPRQPFHVFQTITYR
ncbi:MAG: hypothetical protein QOI38_552 [Sphingomonadales bacterium]|nr:hypothetical protein [Sphingomonadales bacterium]